MTHEGHVGDLELSSLAASLGALRPSSPPPLVDKVFTSWTLVDGMIDEVFVAFTPLGIGFVRTATSVGHDAERFKDAYRERFGRPLQRAAEPPAGLGKAMRTGRSSSLRFDLRGLTDFESTVIRASARIPVGETRPYAWLAREVGRPGATRAVGSALARNPVPLLLPCHRVVRSDGEPGDYVLGAATKESLLRAENVPLDWVRELARSGAYLLGSDSTHVICYPTCHHARRITGPHRRGFRNLTDAVASGYRPCRHCRPGTTQDATARVEGPVGDDSSPS